MQFQDRKLKKGDKLKISSTDQLITLLKTNILGNGRTEMIYYHSEDLNQSNKQQVYLDVLELLGLERVDH